MAMDYFDNIMAERDEKLTGNMYRQQVCVGRSNLSDGSNVLFSYVFA